jgi:hypothetical protein
MNLPLGEMKKQIEATQILLHTFPAFSSDDGALRPRSHRRELREPSDRVISEKECPELAASLVVQLKTHTQIIHFETRKKK